MADLINRIIAAHGGLDRWNQFNIVKGTIVTAGALWGMKGLHQDADPREMTVWLHQEKASVIPFGAPNQRTAFTPDRIAIETTDGELVAERLDPRASSADDMLLRRHDYCVDVSGGFAAAQRVYDYDEANGIRFPTRRRAFLRGTDDSVVNDPLLVSIDLSNVHFA